MNRISRLLPLLSVLAMGRVSADESPRLLSDPVDISGDFHDFSTTYFLADRLAAFDGVKAEGTVLWRRNELAPRIAFDNMEPGLRPFSGMTFPEREYAVDPVLPFSIQFVSPRTVRIRMKTGLPIRPDASSLMLVDDPPHSNSWKYERISGGHRYSSSAGSITILENPWHIELRDAAGCLLTRTITRPTTARRSIRLCRFPSSAVRPIIPAAWRPSFRFPREKSCSDAASPSRGSTSAAKKLCCGPTTPTVWKAWDDSGNVILTVVNLSDNQWDQTIYGVNIGGAGDSWEEIFNSQSPQYGGWNDSGNYLANLVVQSDGRFYIRLPKWSVLIFRKH